MRELTRRLTAVGRKQLATLQQFSRRPGDFLPPSPTLTLPPWLLGLVLAAWMVAMCGLISLSYWDSQRTYQSAAEPDASRPIAVDVKGQTRFITPTAKWAGELAPWLMAIGVPAFIGLCAYTVRRNGDQIKAGRSGRDDEIR